MASLSSNVGSYVLSTNDRASDAKVDVTTACAHVLKLLGARTVMSFPALLSTTGFPVDLLRDALTRLRRDDLIKGSDDELTLTELGYKAHLIVAT